MGAVIKVENLSKQYRLGEVGTGTLKDDFKRFRFRLMGKEDPFLQIGEVNDRTKKSDSDYVWALKDINFEIEQGDVVGIIGRNGAGKSTLLKILSRTTAPTTGSVKVKGRIASLLEVGTGFHGELSGRENIYLNGAIMGLRKWEIDKKLDEIIDFAGVEKYLDTPVKRYSSGMYVRLAFAVAAHLEPDILIVDEVLAVGDAEFQNKCLGKMNDVSKSGDRTIIFVSHQLNSIERLCKKSFLMQKGIISDIGATPDIIKLYSSSFNTILNHKWKNDGSQFINEFFQSTEFRLLKNINDENYLLKANQDIKIFIEGIISKIHKSLVVGIALYDSNYTLLFWSIHTDENKNIEMDLGKNTFVITIPKHIFNEGVYRVELISAIHNQEWINEPKVNSPEIFFKISGELSESNNWSEARPGILAPILKYEKI